MFLIFLFALNLALFFPSLNAYFFLDDADWLVHARNLNTNFHVLLEPEGGRLRPLLLLFYNMQYNLFGLDARFYHACNILVHFLNARLVYVLARKISARLPLSSRQKTFFPVFSSILFSVLFAHYQPVVWLNFISESLCALFALISLILLLKMTEITKISKQLGLLFLSVVFFILSLLTKESSYGYPFIVYFAILLLSPTHRKSAWFFAAPFFIAAVIHFFLTGNFGYITVSQEQNITAARPTLGLHFIPITLDCLTDLLLSPTGIVRIPGYSMLSQSAQGLFHAPLSFLKHLLAGLLFIVLISAFFHLFKSLKAGKLRLIKASLFYPFTRDKTIFSAESSFIIFCALSMIFLFLPNSFFFYLFTQTGASLARYRYLYLPSTTFCMLTGFFFAKALSHSKKINNAFILVIFSLVCAMNMLNTYVMEKYHVAQGNKVKLYIRLLKAARPPLQNNDTAVMQLPEHEALQQSFHIKAYADLFLNKKIDVVWETNPYHSNKIKEKKHVRFIYLGLLDYEK